MSQTAQTIRIRGPATGLDRSGGGSEQSRGPSSTRVGWRIQAQRSAASAAARSSCRLSVRRAMNGFFPLRSIGKLTCKARQFS